ncbi:Hypothetical protein FKW44_001730 [Caligus rogercresseyi]|uniref:Uncharacterized protein n=1 Tax=Caligus rogercresseyi TaxID=217165 RepID=A0A7T8QVT7_CALRO|nr:Hypothetical protein FKW44_001730 [Caligus rogercresseyi]
MNARDRASGDEYPRRLRNRVSSLVKRDHLKSNLAKIHTAKNKPRHSGVCETTYLASPRPLFPPH